MAKKARSAKQRANDKRLGRMAKARSKGRSVKTKTKRIAKRVIKSKTRRRTMAKRKSSPRKKGFKIPLVSSPMFKKASAGVGAGILLTTILGAVGQGQIAQNPIVKGIAGFAVGDVVGGATALVLSGGLGNLFGGQSNGISNNEGFA